MRIILVLAALFLVSTSSQAAERIVSVQLDLNGSLLRHDVYKDHGHYFVQRSTASYSNPPKQLEDDQFEDTLRRYIEPTVMLLSKEPAKKNCGPKSAVVAWPQGSAHVCLDESEPGKTVHRLSTHLEVLVH